MKFVLGSQSPRRKEIVSFFFNDFAQRSSGFEERSVEFNGDPIAYAKAISEGKAKAFTCADDEVILTADSVVHCEGQVYGKPQHLEEAEVVLSELSGQWHEVYTALTVVSKGRMTSQVTETRVKMRELTPEQIQTYVRMIEPLDKAAGYAIQGCGGLIVESIDGCYYNVMGMPLMALDNLLSQAGIDLWKKMSRQDVEKLGH